MDLSIKLVTPEVHEARGAHAYDEGLGVKDHGLPEDSPARKHWENGWHRRRVERSRVRGSQAAPSTPVLAEEAA